MPLGCCFPFPCKRCREPEIQAEALYTEYLSELQNLDPTIGLNGVNWYGTLYPNLYNHKARLVYRFNRHYQLREISRENAEQWMLLLQDRFDEVADRFNHAYKLYDDQTINLDNLGLGYIREYWTSGNSSGSSDANGTSSSDTKFKDTTTNSNSTKNNPTTQNIEDNENSVHSESENTSSGHSKEQLDRHDEHIIDEVNELIRKYRQLDEDFIREFNELFIGIMAKWC